MAGRLNLHEVLCETLGSRNVYFNPPASVKMQYPAIVYNRKRIENTYANNGVYIQSDAYEITVIDYDVDSDIVRRVSLLPKCSFDRNFKSDNLDHNTFTIFY